MYELAETARIYSKQITTLIAGRAVDDELARRLDRLLR